MVGESLLQILFGLNPMALNTQRLIIAFVIIAALEQWNYMVDMVSHIKITMRLTHDT
jgi:hypothetical protein